MIVIKQSQISIIAAAGEGRRCLPISRFIPKEMFPVKNKPAIHYLIQEAKSFGSEQIIVVISKAKQIIKDYIAKEFKNYKVKIVFQKEPRGLFNLLHNVKFDNNKIIHLILGDEVIFFSKKNIAKINESKQTNLIIAQSNIANEKKSNYGMFQVKNKKAISFKEKPQSNLAAYNYGAIGRYFFQAKDLNNHKYKNENDLEFFIKDLVNQNRLQIIENKDLRCDISLPEGLALANE